MFNLDSIKKPMNGRQVVAAISISRRYVFRTTAELDSLGMRRAVPG